MSTNILMITSEYEPDIIGGLGIVSTRLSKELASKGIDVTVVTLARDINSVRVEEHGKLTVIRIPRSGDHYQNRQMDPKAFIPYLEKKSFDLAHIQCVQGLELAKYLKSHYDIPLIYTSHSIGREEAITEGKSNPGRIVSVKHQESLYDTVHAIVCPSSLEKSIFRKHYPGQESKVVVIPNGFQVIGKSGSTSVNPNQLLYVGRLTRPKGLETIIRALPMVAKIHQKVVLHVVGDGSSSYRRHIIGLMKKLHIQNRVIFHPWMDQKELTKFYSSSSMVIVPSNYESFGMVVLEALAHGTPVVATKAVGVAEGLSRSVVMQVQPKNAKEMAQSIHHLLSDRSSAHRRGKDGMELVKQFSWSRIADLYISLYGKMLKK
jgi:glycogen(starch) synthase